MADLYPVAAGDTVNAADVNQFRTALEGGSVQQWALLQKSGANFIVRMATANGSDKVSFQDSASVEVASIDSDGNLIVNGVTYSGAFIFPTSGTPAQTADGSAVWDSDDDQLTIGTGTGRIQLGYPRELARSVTPTSTISIAAVDLVTISTDVTGAALNIPINRWAKVTFEYRKTAASANAVAFGLKLNSTVVLEAVVTAGTPRSSATQRAESGWAEFIIPPRSTANYGFGIGVDYNCYTTAGAFAATYSNDLAAGGTSLPSMTNAVPNAAITSVIIRAINGTASNAAEVDNVSVVVW